MTSPDPRVQPEGLRTSERRPVLVCLGDSITAGGLGADWVAQLGDRLADQAVVVNAGVGGQVTWDLRQRLGDVEEHQPDAVVLLVGSNDAVGAVGGWWASFYRRGRPQAPSEAWFAEQYDALVAELHPLTRRLVCLTLPPLGEDPSTSAQAIVLRQNEAIRATVARRGVELIDLHAALWQLRTESGPNPGVPFLSGLPHFMAWGIASTFRRRVMGQSWDQIAERRGLLLTADTIHPSDRGAEAMLQLIEPWARGALLEARPPGSHDA